MKKIKIIKTIKTFKTIKMVAAGSTNSHRPKQQPIPDLVMVLMVPMVL